MRDGKGVGIFVSALCASLVVLGAVFLALTVTLRESGGTAAGSEPPVSSESPEKLREQNLAWVLIGCREAADEPGFLLAGYYDAEAGSLSAVVIPPQTAATQAGRTDTLVGHYEYEGVRGGVNGVKSLLDADILRYFRITQSGIAALTDFLGGVDYRLEEDTVMDGQTFLAGDQLLDGRRLAAFLFGRERLGVTDALLSAELTGRLFEEGLSEELSDRVYPFISLLLEQTETNLSQYDLVMRAERLGALLAAGELRVEVRALEGEYNADRSVFTPSADSLAAAQAIFPRAVRLVVSTRSHFSFAAQ